MNQLETAMGVAIALRYLHEQVRERKLRMGTQMKPTVMQAGIQVIGRLLMTMGVGMMITGKRLARLGQSEASC